MTCHAYLLSIPGTNEAGGRNRGHAVCTGGGGDLAPTAIKSYHNNHAQYSCKRNHAQY